MHLSILFGALAATGAFAYSRVGLAKDFPDLNYCGTPEPTFEQLQQSLEIRDTPFAPDEKINVDTYFHLIYSEDHYAVDFDKWFGNQLLEMIRSYAPYSINFNLRDVTRTKHAEWAKGLEKNEIEMKSHHRQGDYASLNLYFLSDFSLNSKTDIGITLGLAQFPEYHKNDDKVEEALFERSPLFCTDGAKVDLNTMPGGKPLLGIKEYKVNNLGRTAIHEIGHWMGLYHTFQNRTDDACNADDEGDGVDDTPKQREASKACAPKNALDKFCGVKPKEHQLHNVMDYGPDKCRTDFTPGQGIVMRQSWFKHRAMHKGWRN